MAWTTEIAGDGTVTAAVELKVVIPDVPSVVSTRVDYQKAGATAWTTGAVITARGEQRVRIGALVPGQFYNFRAVTVGAMESTPMFLNNQLALGDTTTPSAPTAMQARQSGGGKIVELEATFTAPPDWGTVVWYRNTFNNSATAAEIGRGKTTRFTDRNVSYTCCPRPWPSRSRSSRGGIAACRYESGFLQVAELKR